MKILIINGPNINMLGVREKDIYGDQTYSQLLAQINKWSTDYGVEIKHVQSNHEGVLIDEIQAAYGQFDAIIINPAAYTHTSIAILDALKAVNLPSVEVHISNICERESFRQVSYAGMACEKTISGQGFDGYRQAIQYLTEKYK